MRENQLIFPDTYPFNIKDFEFVENIGVGTFGSIKKYRYKPTGVNVVLKYIRVPQNHNYKQLQNSLNSNLISEITNLRLLSTFPNLVKFYGLCIHENEAIICMEYMDLSLDEFYPLVHQNLFKFPEEFMGYITIQIVQALDYCRFYNFASLVIKPKKVLLKRSGEVKLCDYGEANFYTDSMTNCLVQDIAYWSPEKMSSINKTNSSLKNLSNIQEPYPDNVEESINVSNILNETKGTKLTYFIKEIYYDVHGLGMTLTEIAIGKLPYTEQDFEKYLNKNMLFFINNFKNIQEDLTCYSDSFRNFIYNCLAINENVAQTPDNAPLCFSSGIELKETEFYKFYGHVTAQMMSTFITGIEKNGTQYQVGYKIKVIIAVKFAMDKLYQIRICFTERW